MSEQGHEAAASGHEQEASQHASMYDPAARAEQERCSGAGARAPVTDACWTSSVNPTEEHLREAEHHRRMAADHRAASQTLRDAETRACAGLRDSDRDMSPFAHREDIVSVAPLDDQRGTPDHGAGAVVTFRAVPGMSVEWLQRVVDCHIARSAAFGHEMPEMDYCPLMPNGVTARVSSSGAGFAVAIRSVDTATVAEIRRRALALTASARPAAQ